jgi:hypothetical protein
MDALTTPDPIAVALLRSKSKSKKAASSSSSSSGVRVAADPSSGEPYAALLFMPPASTSSGTMDKFYNIQLLALDLNQGSGEGFFLFSR